MYAEFAFESNQPLFLKSCICKCAVYILIAEIFFRIHNSGSKIVLVKPCQRVAAKLSNVPIRTGLKKPVSMPAMADCEDDSVRTFCTEDTPANISHAASHSDLSMLCASSDDGSDYENILAECIQSGMPQVSFIHPLSVDL